MTKSISSRFPSFALLLALLVPCRMEAQALSFPAAAITDTTTRSAAVARLATEAAAVYRDSNQLTQLDNLFRLQLLARPSRRGPRDPGRIPQRPRRVEATPHPRAARSTHSSRSISGPSSSRPTLRPRSPTPSARAFRERFARLDDRTAALVIAHLAPPAGAGDALGPAGKGARDTTVALADAVAWLRGVQIAGLTPSSARSPLR